MLSWGLLFEEHSDSMLWWDEQVDEQVEAQVEVLTSLAVGIAGFVDPIEEGSAQRLEARGLVQLGALVVPLFKLDVL